MARAPEFIKTHADKDGDKLLNSSVSLDLQNLSPEDLVPRVNAPNTPPIGKLKGEAAGKSFKKAARTIMVVGAATSGNKKRNGGLSRKWSSVHPARPIRFEGFTTNLHSHSPSSTWGMDWFVGTLAGQLAALLLLLVVIGFVSMVVWSNILDAGTDNGDDYGGLNNWTEVVWFVWNLLFDSGTAFEGLSGSASHKVLIVAAVISVVGFVFNLTLLGFVVDRLREVLDEAKEVYGRDVCNDHILLLGWTDKTLFLLQELMTELSSEPRGWFDARPKIVILGGSPRLQMLQEVRAVIPKHLMCRNNVKLIFRQGMPNEIEDLTKVSVLSARVVIVLGEARDPEISDCMVTSVVLAVQALASSNAENAHDEYGEDAADAAAEARAPVIAEVNLPETVNVLRALGGPSVYGINSKPVVDNLMVLCALSPAVGLLLSDLVSFHGTSNLQILQQPQDEFEGRSSSQMSHVTAGGHKNEAGMWQNISRSSSKASEVPSRTFGEARLLFDDAIVLAVVPPANSAGIVFAPPDTYKLSPADGLLVIARATRADRDSVDKHDDSTGDDLSWDAASDRLRSTVSGASPTNAATPGSAPIQVKPANASDGKGGEVGDDDDDDDEEVVVVLGWRPGASMSLMLQALDDRVPAGTKVHILSMRSETARLRDLQVGDFRPKHIVMVHHRGEITHRLSLERVPLLKARAILISSDEGNENSGENGPTRYNEGDVVRVIKEGSSKKGLKATVEDPDWKGLIKVKLDGRTISYTPLEIEHASGGGGIIGGGRATSAHVDDRAYAQVADARALTVAVIVSDILEEGATSVGRLRGIQRSAAIGLASGSHRPPLATQFLDNLTQRILSRQPHLFQHLESLVPVHRNALETGVLALAASDPKMMALFTSLLVKRDGESMAPTPFTCEPAMVHLPTGSSDGSHLEHTASFREIDATLRDAGRLLIGWHRLGRSHACVNPRYKDRRLRWRTGDVLLVAIDPEIRTGSMMHRAKAIAQYKNQAAAGASFELIFGGESSLPHPSSDDVTSSTHAWANNKKAAAASCATAAEESKSTPKSTPRSSKESVSSNGKPTRPNRPKSPGGKKDAKKDNSKDRDHGSKF